MTSLPKSIVLITLLGLGALASACGDDDGGGAGGSGSASAGGTGGASTASSGGTGGSGTGGGTTCGGLSGGMCADDEYCDYSRNTCGASDEQGTCKPRPTACDEIYSPVCACGGKVYGNACEAQMAGADISDLGGCAPPDAGSFACGSTFCAKNQQYCELTTSDVGGFPDSYMCKSYPAACMAPADCACLANEPCGNLCDTLPEGQLKLTCPGG